MGNLIRFVAYTFRGSPKRSKHRRGFLRKNAIAIIGGFFGALVLSMPAWMILLGVI